MMKKLLTFALCTPLLCQAWGVLDKNADGSYRSSSGDRYQYDLSRPADQLRYEIDPAAQLRDEMAPPRPVRELMEEVRGQSGGGLYLD
jgi:hypothetical protein